MNIAYGLEQFHKLPNAVVTSGTFDGVHLGHQKILARLHEVTQTTGGESVVITYFPHPRMVVAADSQELKLLSTLDEKIHLLAAQGVDHLLIIPFTRDFSLWSSEEFIQKILLQTLGTKTLVIGYDHRFGRNREGGFEYLRNNADRYGFRIEEIPRQDLDRVAVSSTQTRAALLAGQVHQAALYLGRNYSLTGTVVKGRQLGRTLGYPTANLELPEAYKLIPADGVYVVRVNWKNQDFGGMLSIGTNPTVEGTHRTIEVNIFDFDHDIYGEKLTLNFVAWLRGQIKYDRLDALVEQIGRDKADSLRVLSANQSAHSTNFT